MVSFFSVFITPHCCNAEFYFSEFLQRLSEAIFGPPNATDLRMLKDTLKIGGADDSVFQSIPKSHLRRFCRRSINCASTLMRNLEAVVNKFTNINGDHLLTDKTRQVHECTLGNINNGLFFDPPGHLYSEKTKLKNGLTVWRCVRGTSQLEGFHGHLRRWLRAGIMSPVLLHALLQDAIQLWNYNRGEVVQA